jgi:hypothetical protein
MKRKKGDLPGRYVPPYIRKRRKQPCEYESVAGYQEYVEPLPSQLESMPQQGEFDLPTPAEEDEKDPDDDIEP